MALARRWVAVALCVAGLSACGATYNDSDRFWNDAFFWNQGKTSAAAMAALSKGDFVQAESLGNDAMRQNPKDPYALLALAVVYENTARPDLARQYFQVLASMNPQATALIGVGPKAERRTIADIARLHLAALGATPPAANTDSMAQPALLKVPPPPAVSEAELGANDDTNIILRFQTLRRLLDDGLITRDEYNRRRGANLGALLPYTAPAPADGLGRPAPAPDQVVQRLRFLAEAYRQRGMTADEQAAERAIILDALLPAVVARRADPPPPLTDQLQVAAVVGRMEKLRAANVITEGEENREKAAAFRDLQMHQAAAEASARSAAGLAPPPLAAPTGPGIRLAAYRTEDRARRAWAGLRRAFSADLADLQPVVSKVHLRRHRVAYRLSAGPLPNRRAAFDLCRRLRHYGHACEVTVLP